MYLLSSDFRAIASSFFWLYFISCAFHLCFSTLHIVGSLLFKLPSIICDIMIPSLCQYLIPRICGTVSRTLVNLGLHLTRCFDIVTRMYPNGFTQAFQPKDCISDVSSFHSFPLALWILSKAAFWRQLSLKPVAMFSDISFSLWWLFVPRS